MSVVYQIVTTYIALPSYSFIFPNPMPCVRNYFLTICCRIVGGQYISHTFLHILQSAWGTPCHLASALLHQGAGHED